MAILHSHIQFTGSLGKISAYKMRGTDKIVLRTKGGPTRKQLKTGASYTNARRAGAEFGGRASASKWVIRALGSLKNLGDDNLSGRINAVLQPIQCMDTENEWGRRSVQLTKCPQLLSGFPLQNNLSFEGVVRTQVAFSLSREHRSAHVEIPALLPRINFFAANYPYYRLGLAWGMMPDLFYNERAGKYTPTSDYPTTVETETPWCACRDRSLPATFDLAISQLPPDENFSLMLTIGINYGMIRNGVIEQVPKVGCGKVMAVE